jgi:hypothetical protein
METELHRELKLLYAADATQTEIVLGEFRIDAISATGELIEIQHASLGALRAKMRKLLSAKEHHRVRIVKPIVAHKWIVTLDGDTRLPLRRRLSPKRGQISDVFQDLVHFVELFPHPQLTLDVLLVDTEEVRLPKAKQRFKRKNYHVQCQRLLETVSSISLRGASDLFQLLPDLQLPRKFDTAQLAQAIERPRWFAQKVAYCLRHTGGLKLAGKSGNSQLYSRAARKRGSKGQAA